SMDDGCKTVIPAVRKRTAVKFTNCFQISAREKSRRNVRVFGFRIKNIAQSAAWTFFNLFDDLRCRSTIHSDPWSLSWIKNPDQAFPAQRGMLANAGFPDNS
ncbi:MAG TPA: hypothetical protein VGI82_09030, partial [Chitinophagaceae bacterium]